MALAALLCLCLVGKAQSVIERYPDAVELDPFGGGSFWHPVNQGPGEKLVNGGTAGGRATYNIWKRFGIELNYNFMRNNVRTVVVSRVGFFNYNFGNQIHSLAIDPIYYFNSRGARVRPYVTAGAGPIWFVPTKQATDFAELPANQATYQAASLGKSVEPALNYGGGVKWHISPHLGVRFDARGIFTRNPGFGLPTSSASGPYVPKANLNGVSATAGLVFYLGRAPVTVVHEPVKPVLPVLLPINPGELAGANGQLCQGRPITVHATSTDPAGHALNYVWKLNGNAQGTNSPDFSFTPNNSGDFSLEADISDASDATRTIRAGPRTLTVHDYTAPQISSVTASPNVLAFSPDSAAPVSNLSARVSNSSCGGNMSYKWSVSEGSVSNDTSLNAIFAGSSLNFEPGLGQTKSIAVTFTATDETGRSASQSTTITANYPAQYKRLPDIMFARNSARVNNCGKRILMEQAAPQAGTAYDILLVGHRASGELERITAKAARTLDEERLLATAAVLTAGHGSCATVDISQIRMEAAATNQVSEPDPSQCGTSVLPSNARQEGLSGADKERRVEVYLAPRGSQLLPPAAKNALVIPVEALKARGCPK